MRAERHDLITICLHLVLCEISFCGMQRGSCAPYCGHPQPHSVHCAWKSGLGSPWFIAGTCGFRALKITSIKLPWNCYPQPGGKVASSVPEIRMPDPPTCDRSPRLSRGLWARYDKPADYPEELPDSAVQPVRIRHPLNQYGLAESSGVKPPDFPIKL